MVALKRLILLLILVYLPLVFDEMLKKTFILLSYFFLVASAMIVGQPGGNNTCITADPFCGSTAYTYLSGSCQTNCFGETGPCYSCMGTPHNPAWYYLQISTPGTIILSISENPYNDIDFCCWGPFTSPTGACTSGLTCSKVISCSFSPSGIEICTIPNALAGEFYMLVLSNFTNMTTQVTFQQSNWGQAGAGSTNCNLVTHCSVSAITATPSSCSTTTNTFSVSGTVEFSNPPSSGTLTITDITAIPPVLHVLTPPFVSPEAYLLSGIPCDGTVHSIQAVFSDSTNCLYSSTYQSPTPECPAAVMSGGGTYCDNGTNTGIVNIYISGGVVPYSFTYAINGIPQTPVTNYSGPFPYIITATSSGSYSLISVSSNTCSGTVSGSAVVTFLPLPIVNFTTPSPVCDHDPPFALSGGTPPGGSYSGPGVIAGIFNPPVAGAGTHTLTYTYTNTSNCTNSAQANIFVDLKPRLTNYPMSDTICSGTTAIISLTSSNASATFTWVANLQSGSVTGFTNGNGPTITQTLINTGTNTGVVAYTIHQVSSTCTGNDTIFSIVVRPVPALTNNPLSSEICSRTETNIGLLSNVTGTVFSWMVAGSSGNVTGFSNGNGSILKQTLNNSSFNPETVSYLITPVANECTGASSPYVITVNPVPFVTNIRCFDSVTTISAKPIKLKGGTPLGGLYSGPGVSGSYFYPAMAGAGTHTITYTYTNSSLCSASGFWLLAVRSVSPFNCGSFLTDIRDSRNYQTVQIGSQCWFAEDLNFGIAIPSNQHQRDNCISEHYQKPVASGQQPAAAYQWDELMRYDDTPGLQGLCPPAWHVPKEAEWNTLFSFYINNGFAGSPLKYSGFSGFNALLSGVNHFNRQWDFNGFATFFWSSTAYGPYKAWAHGMNDFNPSVSFYPSSRGNAFSVRCLKDI